jgi:hypothetical protein
MHRVGAWGPGRCAWAHRYAQGCTWMHRDAHGLAGLHRASQGCTGMHRAPQGCARMDMRLLCSSSNCLPALHRSPPQAIVVGQPSCPAQAKPVAKKRALPRHAWSVLLSAAGGCYQAGTVAVSWSVGLYVHIWINACMQCAAWCAWCPCCPTSRCMAGDIRHATLTADAHLTLSVRVFG